MWVRVQRDGVEQTLSMEDFEARVSQGTLGPGVPVQMPGSSQWIPAGDLPAWRAIADAPAARLRRAWQAAGPPWGTLLVAAAILRAQIGAPLVVDIDRLVRSDAAILEHREVWRLLSYAFVHAGPAHLVGNLVALVYVGAVLEAAVGPAAILAIFAASVIGGGYLSVLGAESESVGASAGDFGFIAAAIVFGWRHGDVVPERLRAAFGGTLSLFLLLGLVSGAADPRVDNLAHLGGAVVGVALGAQLQIGTNRRVVATAGALIVGVVALALALPLPTSVADAPGLNARVPTGWTQSWTPTGERGWGSPLGDAWVVARRERYADPTEARAVADAIVARHRAHDPHARVTRTDADTTAELTIDWETADGLRQTRAWIAVEGRDVTIRSRDTPAARWWDRRPARLDALLAEVRSAPDAARRPR